MTHDHDDALDKLQCKLEKCKRAALEAQIDIKETVTETIETMEENMHEQLEQVCFA